MITFHQILEIKITKMNKIEILELITASINNISTIFHLYSFTICWLFTHIIFILLVKVEAKLNSEPQLNETCALFLAVKSLYGASFPFGSARTSSLPWMFLPAGGTPLCLPDHPALLGIPFEWGQSKCLQVEFTTLSHFCPCTTLASDTSLCVYPFFLFSKVNYIESNQCF